MSDTGPRPLGEFFDAAYREAPPWEVGKAQPALLALFDEFPPAGPALDLGCGTGELSLALARRGLAVLGVDLAARAIDLARAKSFAAAPEIRRLVEFHVADALQPSQLPGQFGTVADSGFYHLFDPPEREGLARELAAALSPGGRYYLLGLAISTCYPNSPREVRAEELQALFSPERGWRILGLHPARFLTRTPLGELPAIAACIERVARAETP